MAILPPAFFGGRTDPWTTFIQDYQTLITGILAIVAAFVTVRQMQRSDERAEKRHAEVIALTMRGDRLKIQRMLVPQLAELKVLYKMLNNFVFAASHPDERPQAFGWNFANEATGEYLQAAKNVQKVLSRAQFVEAIPLFDGGSVFMLDLLKNLNADLIRQIEYHEVMRNAAPDDLANYYAKFEDEGVGQRFVDRIKSLPIAVEALIVQLEALGAEYDLEN